MILLHYLSHYHIILPSLILIYFSSHVVSAPLRIPNLNLRQEQEEERQSHNDNNILKVYVLAGQSNMEGHGEVSTMDKTTPMNGTLLYQLLDPRTRYEFSKLWNASRWSSWPNIQVWFNEAGKEMGVNGSKVPGVNNVDFSAGDLTVGFGTGGPSGNENNFFGPELGFGVGLNTSSEEKILIIKTAWGGKSLAVDFRPPSSTFDEDPYCQLPDCNPYKVGHFYKVMLYNVRQILNNLPDVFPQFSTLTPVLSGFGWFQGWNDGCDLNATAAYEQNLVNLIKDLRREWDDPYLPVSIAVSGFGGFNGVQRQPPNCFDDTVDKLHCDCGVADHGCRRLNIIESQFRAGDMSRNRDQLKCCVVASETRGFWRDAIYSPNANQGYHFNHNAETHFLIGKALAEGMILATIAQKKEKVLSLQTTRIQTHPTLGLKRWFNQREN